MSQADRDPDAFAQELAGLKREGCTLLVVSPPCGRARCEDLLGEDDRGRERIVVDTGQHSSEHDDDRVVIDGGVRAVRSASATASGTTPPDPDLETITSGLLEWIREFDSGGLEPGELRVCFGDAKTLAARNGGDIAAYLRAASETVRSVAGMGHCHLPLTSPLRDEIEPTFDVTVEIRTTPGGRQQRWLLHDADLDSGWLAIED